MDRKKEIEEMARTTASYITSDKDMQEDFADMLRMGAEWADGHPHWISVKDELPPKQPNREQSKNVLVRTNSGRTKIEYYDYGNDVIKEWWEYNITHWMPLPLPPKEGGQTL